MSSAGERLRNIRKELNLSQQSFGLKYGLKWYQVRDMESGKVELSTHLAMLISQDLKVSADYLLSGQGKQYLTVGKDNSAKNALSAHPAIKKIVDILASADESVRQDVLRYVEKEKLFSELKRERRNTRR